MPIPTEHTTVQARILAYAEAIGWTIVSREEARKQVTFAIFSEEDDLNKVTTTVDALFTLLQRSYKA